MIGPSAVLLQVAPASVHDSNGPYAVLLKTTGLIVGETPFQVEQTDILQAAWECQCFWQGWECHVQGLQGRSACANITKRILSACEPFYICCADSTRSLRLLVSSVSCISAKMSTNNGGAYFYLQGVVGVVILTNLGPLDVVKMVEIDGHATVLALAFFPDCKHLVSGGEEWMGRQWRIEDGQEIGRELAVGSNLEAITVSPDCKWIITGYNRTATVWDAKTHERVTEFKGHRNEVYSVDVSPDSTRVASGSMDRTAYVWSITTGERLVGPLEHSYLVAAVRFSPSGDCIAVATCQRESIKIYNSHDGQQLVDIPARVETWPTTALAWCSDGRHLFAASDKEIMYLDGSIGSVLSAWPHEIEGGDFTSIALANNGSFIVCSAEHSITFWDTSTHARIGPVIETSGLVRSIALTRDDSCLASGENNGRITLRRLTEILPESYCFVQVYISCLCSSHFLMTALQTDTPLAHHLYGVQVIRQRGPYHS